MTLSTLDVLQGARELLSNPVRWIKGDYSDVQCDPLHPDATCWCLSGALYRITGSDTPTPPYAEACRVLGRLAGQGAILFNDEESTTHADVLALLDRAIASVEGTA